VNVEEEIFSLTGKTKIKSSEVCLLKTLPKSLLFYYLETSDHSDVEERVRRLNEVLEKEKKKAEALERKKRKIKRSVMKKEALKLELEIKVRCKIFLKIPIVTRIFF
jgi:hypothetical protein